MKRIAILPLIFLAGTLNACTQKNDGPDKNDFRQNTTSNDSNNSNTQKPDDNNNKQDNNDQKKDDNNDNDQKESLNGTPCNRLYDTQQCEGEAIATCLWNTWVTVDCDRGTVCRTSKNEGVVGCVAGCETGTATTTSCHLDENYSEQLEEDVFVEKSLICEQATDNNYYLFTHENICGHGCADNACAQLSDDEGQKCNPAAYEEKCRDGSIVWCYESEEGQAVVAAVKCDSGTSCQKIKGKNFVECVLPCSEENAGGSFCHEADDEHYGLLWAEDTVCQLAEDNQLYAFPNGDETICQSCENNHCTEYDYE